MRRLPPLAAIRAFEAAARTENFTAAAAELGMTQAAVSYQVKSLEERLGAPLFVREKGRARLTPFGQRLLPALSSAFDAIEAAFASHREEDESLLTITTTHTFANTWLAWRLGGFQMEHADLAVRMTTSNELCDFAAAMPTSRSAPAMAAGKGWRISPVRVQLHADGQSRVPRGGRTQARPQARAARHAASEPDQSERRLVAAMVRRQWRSAPMNRPAAGPASGSKTRPTRVMRRWRGMASRC